MAPQLSSPSELSYIHTSLLHHPPIRPDGRLPRTFRPLSAETHLLDAANGSARVCAGEGVEVIVGVRGEVQQRRRRRRTEQDEGDDEGEEAGWVEVTLDVPGTREDDAAVGFLAGVVREGIVDGLEGRLGINEGWRWGVGVDILLLCAPSQIQSLSYAIPLLSFATHLALLTTRLPALVSRGEEDPLFDDDWGAAVPLYDCDADCRRSGEREHEEDKVRRMTSKPPVVLLVAAVGDNIFFDPSAEELAVADAVVAVTVAGVERKGKSKDKEGEGKEEDGAPVQVVAVRMIDPPARLSSAGATDGGAEGEMEEKEEGVWKPKRGGVSRKVVKRMVGMCVERGGAGEEVLNGLGAFL